MSDIFDVLDYLQEEGKCHYIDYLPERMESPRYFMLEEFWLKNYLHDFAEKIVKIAFKLIHYFPAHICVTGCSEKACQKFSHLLDQDLRNMPLEEMKALIIDVITNDVSSVQILLEDSDLFVMSIRGEFSVDFYNIPEERLELIHLLVSQENLFFKSEE